MRSIAFDAMMFAREVHAGQVRKYTGAPYTDHLAEVAGIMSSVSGADDVCAVAWLHDTIEDQNVTVETLASKFGWIVARGVAFLSDLEEGSRVERKAASRKRLSEAPYWVQTIKCADLISNTSSIVLHDPKFAVTYLAEKRALLEVMNEADRRLWDIAWELANQEVPAQTYTIVEVDAACQAIVPRVAAVSTARPHTMERAAAEAFLRKRPEDDHTRVLRAGLKDLEKAGVLKPVDGVWPDA